MKSIFIPPRHFAHVDDDFCEAVLDIGRWSYSAGYAFHWYTDATGTRRRLWLHRWIAERMFGSIPAGMQVDHIDANRLNCQRANLRLATRSENQAAKGPQINSSSGCKGINLRNGKYDVRIRVGGGRRLYLGRYDDLFTALTVYGFCHKAVWGEFTTEANVPDPSPELQEYVLGRLKQLGIEMKQEGQALELV